MRAAYLVRRPNPPESKPVASGPGKKSILPIVVGAGAAGALAYFVFRKRAHAAALPPPSSYQPATSTGTAASGGGPQTSSGPTYGPNGPDPSPSLVARLRGSDSARQIFFLQAYLYSIGYTNAVPDGIEGPVTDAMIYGATQGNPGGAFTSYGPGVLAAVKAGTVGIASNAALRNLPFTLPGDLVASVQASAAAVDPGGAATDLLAVLTTEANPNPAGQMIPVAGYSRPPSMAPFNSVAGNPGWGVITDPNGINIGLWEALSGWQHGPLGTGNVATDVHRNPVAGQGGDYFDGFPYLGHSPQVQYDVRGLFRG